MTVEDRETLVSSYIPQEMRRLLLAKPVDVSDKPFSQFLCAGVVGYPTMNRRKRSASFEEVSRFRAMKTDVVRSVAEKLLGIESCLRKSMLAEKVDDTFGVLCLRLRSQKTVHKLVKILVGRDPGKIIKPRADQLPDFPVPLS